MKKETRMFAILTLVESLVILIVPFCLYGFWRGLLISSGLSSALHAVLLLKGIDEKLGKVIK